MTKQRLLIAAAATLVAITFWWLTESEDLANYPPSATGPWVAFGDSLTHGVGAAAGDDYPSVLSQRIDYPITNLGVSGDTTADGLRRLSAALELEPRVVLLCLGGNDALRKVPQEETFANLSSMVDQFHLTGSFVVLLGVRSATLIGDRNEEAFQALAEEKRIAYMPNILDGIFGRPALMADPIHPNANGYAKIVDRLERTLRPYLDDLR